MHHIVEEMRQKLIKGELTTELQRETALAIILAQDKIYTPPRVAIKSRRVAAMFLLGCSYSQLSAVFGIRRETAVAHVKRWNAKRTAKMERPSPEQLEDMIEQVLSIPDSELVRMTPQQIADLVRQRITSPND